MHDGQKKPKTTEKEKDQWFPGVLGNGGRMKK